MTAKLVSIRTRSGDDLTPVPALRSGQTISQRQALQKICKRADPPIWQIVEQRLISAAEEPSQRGFTCNYRWTRAVLLVVAAAALSIGLISMNW